MGRGATKREGGGGHVKFYPPRKGGRGGKSFSHPEGGGGGTKGFEVVLTRELDVLAIVMGGRKKFPPFKTGGTTSFGPAIFPFCSPPPIINDQSLIIMSFERPDLKMVSLQR